MAVQNYPQYDTDWDPFTWATWARELTEQFDALEARYDTDIPALGSRVGGVETRVTTAETDITNLQNEVSGIGSAALPATIISTLPATPENGRFYFPTVEIATGQTTNFSSGATTGQTDDYHWESWDYNHTTNQMTLFTNLAQLMVTGTGNAGVQVDIDGNRNSYVIDQGGANFNAAGNGVVLTPTDQHRDSIRAMGQNATIERINGPGRLRSNVNANFQLANEITGSFQVDNYFGLPGAPLQANSLYIYNNEYRLVSATTTL